LNKYPLTNSNLSKKQLAQDVAKQFSLVQDRKVYVGKNFVIRFCQTSGSSFSNTVIGLATIQKYDHIPFVVCVVSSKNITLYLSNSSFLKKIGHSSQNLTLENVSGSILGSNIMREHCGVSNIPQNFVQLFETHKSLKWEDNLSRLVQATAEIKPSGTQFIPTQQQKSLILSSAKLASSISGTSSYLAIKTKLDEIGDFQRLGILGIAKDEAENINIRGNKIEQIFTNASNQHSLEDLSFDIKPNIKVLVDVKTKIIGKNSNTKSYNVDKALKHLATGNIIICFYYIAIDLNKETLSTQLVSILDTTIVKNTKFQYHWSGKNSRGATQLNSGISNIFQPDFTESIDVSNAESFLQTLIDKEAKS